MDAQLKAEIEELVQKHPVLLFMKGTKSFPQCGFSATVVNILKEAGVRELKDVNILARADLREGMKEYTSWPTFPQLYVKGQFVGGADIVKELFASGEIYDVLGTAKPEVKAPTVTVTEAAKRAVLEAGEGEAVAALRIEISPQFEYALSVDEPNEGDIKVDAGGLTLVFDRQSALRADGLRIDFLAADGGGFKIDNPNEPPRVKQIGPRDLKALIDAGKSFELFDVRSNEERNIVKLEQAQHFDKAAQEKLAKLDKDTPIYFHCHHGGRSQQAAEHYLRQGFKHVFNVAGGIDGYALEVDPELARY
ncbi:MAG: Grx4 family monothiol glutaredoxin [Myxococcales bacterium]